MSYREHVNSEMVRSNATNKFYVRCTIMRKLTVRGKHCRRKCSAVQYMNQAPLLSSHLLTVYYIPQLHCDAAFNNNTKKCTNTEHCQSASWKSLRICLPCFTTGECPTGSHSPPSAPSLPSNSTQISFTRPTSARGELY